MSSLTPLFIRAATPADYVACRRLTNQAANREGFGFVSRATFDDFANRQAETPRYILRVATDNNGTVLGYVRALALQNGQQVTIHEICRDTAVKGQGVGTALLGAVEDFARAQGIDKLFLKTPTGIRAHAAYQRFGFNLVQTEDRPAKDNGNPSRTLVHFEKKLKI